MRVKTEAKRLAILAAAKATFLERGYEASSMAQVSVRAGGSKQTLYNYFSSKEELFVAVMLETAAKRFDPLFAAFCADSPVAMKPALAGFGRAWLALVGSDEPLAARRIIAAEGARSNLGRLFYENGPRRGWTQMAEGFAQAMAAGRLRPADPGRAAGHFQALLEAGPYQRLLEGSADRPSPDDIAAAVDAAVDVFWRAYGPAD